MYITIPCLSKSLALFGLDGKKKFYMPWSDYLTSLRDETRPIGVSRSGAHLVRVSELLRGVRVWGTALDSVKLRRSSTLSTGNDARDLPRTVSPNEPCAGLERTSNGYMELDRWSIRHTIRLPK